MNYPEPTWGVILAPPDSRAEAAIIGRALEAGRSVFTIDLAEVTDQLSLLGLLGRELLFPYEARNFDAALGLMVGLEWFGNDDGYLYVLRSLRALNQVDRKLLDTFLDMLPNLCDRWHSAGTPFDVLVVGEPELRRRMYRFVERWNDMIRNGRWNVPMHEVPVREFNG